MQNSCFFKQQLFTFHIFVLVSELLGFAQPDAVDDGGVVELVGDDGVVRTQQLLEDARVCVEAACVQDGVLPAVEVRYFALQILIKVNSLFSAAKSQRSRSYLSCCSFFCLCLYLPYVHLQSQFVSRWSVSSTLYFMHNIGVDWIQTADLWYRKEPLYQLRHNHCPINIFCSFQYSLH